MKYIFSCILVCSVFFSFPQTPERYRTEWNGGLCSGIIILYPDYSYVYEQGCEASSHLSFGKWVKTKDTIKLQPVNPQTYKVIKEVVATTVPGDSIWLTLVDKEGVNMSSQISTGLEIAGRGSYLFSMDSSGTQKFVYKRSGGKIVLRTLNKLFGQRLELPTGSANHFIVRLNLAADWISSTHADWGGSNLVRLIKKGEDLVTVEKFPEQRVFQKQ